MLFSVEDELKRAVYRNGEERKVDSVLTDLQESVLKGLNMTTGLKRGEIASEVDEKGKFLDKLARIESTWSRIYSAWRRLLPQKNS